MKLHLGIFALLALVLSTTIGASQNSPTYTLENVKKSRDTNEYYANRHAFYDRVDLSFSKFPIDTELPEIKNNLTIIPCGPYKDECEWKDAEGNRLYFWAAYWEKGEESGTDYILTIKTVVAAEFAGRSISALGIGKARKRDEVLKNVEKFLPGLEIDCNGRPSGNVGPIECGGTVDPGWFQIGFDEKGNLLEVRFDGYHFT